MTSITQPTVASGDNADVAFLILAHHQPNHLARLVRALDNRSSHIFIHVDGKMPLGPFRAAVPAQSNITFVNDRLMVEWGKLSVVQATLQLIDLAIASKPSFRYFSLLSGSDYPIRPIGEIIARLNTSNRQHLRVDRGVTNDPADTHHHVLRDLPGGRYFGDLTPYHGSMYWALTGDCIRYVQEFLQDNPEFMDFHRNVATPDEVVFHTILKHSPFADAITQDYSGRSAPEHTRHANHFIDWRKPWPHADLTLEQSRLDELLASGCLFARKFDETKSAQLLDLLDQRVHIARR